MPVLLIAFWFSVLDPPHASEPQRGRQVHSFAVIIPVHIRDFHATVLHLLGFDHERFTFKYQGLDQKLTGVEPCRVVKELLA